MATVSSISWFKRYRMEVLLEELPGPELPPGFRCLPWHADLLDDHARTHHIHHRS